MELVQIPYRWLLIYPSTPSVKIEREQIKLPFYHQIFFSNFGELFAKMSCGIPFISGFANCGLELHYYTIPSEMFALNIKKYFRTRII